MKKREIKKWNEAKECMGNDRVTLGPHYTYILKNLPRRLLFVLSHYKFAAKLIGDQKYVLEVGCSEGFGTVLLAETAKKVVGVDFDKNAIAEAKKSFSSQRLEFMAADFLSKKIGSFDAVVAFDVIEHIYPENANKFLKTICKNLKKQGICIVGTPNKTAQRYASKTSRIGHVNLYTWDRLKGTLEDFFYQVFIFSGNDEVIHTGFYPMAHYLIGVGIGKK